MEVSLLQQGSAKLVELTVSEEEKWNES